MALKTFQDGTQFTFQDGTEYAFQDGGAELWTPAQITTKLWLDAADTTTITETAGAVSAWADKSVNGYSIEQLTGSLQPTTGASTQNGKNVLDFAGDYLALNGAVTDFDELHRAVESQIYIAFKAGTVANPDAAYALLTTFNGSSGSTGQSISWDDRSSFSRNNELRVFTGRGVSSQPTVDNLSTTGPAPANTFLTMSAIVDNGNATPADRSFIAVDGNTPFQNNTFTGAASTSTSSSAVLRVGAYDGGGNAMVGQIAEIIIVVDTFDQDRHDTIQGYLAWKWGTQANLPGGHPYKSAAPLASLWTPADMSTVLWLDAADASTITLGTGVEVAQWADKSGLDNHASQAVAADRPDYDAINKYVRFPNSGKAEYLSGTGIPVGIHNGDSVRVLVVQADAVSNDAYSTMLQIGTGTLDDVIWRYEKDTANLWQMFYNGDGTASTATQTPWVANQETDTKIISVERSGGTIKIFQDGVQLGTASHADDTLTGDQDYYISRGTFVNGWALKGNFYEVLVAGDPTERQRLEGYVAWKWGLESELPAGHPYEFAAPTAAGGPISVQLGIAAEIDAALPFLSPVSVQLDIAAEVDAALRFGYPQELPLGLAAEIDAAPAMSPTTLIPTGFAAEIDAALPVTVDYFIHSAITGPSDVTVAYGQSGTLTISIDGAISTPPYTVDWYNNVSGLVYADAGLSITHTPGPSPPNTLWWAVVTDSGGLQGQSGVATMAVVPAQLELSWSIENGKPDTTVIVYQSIAWSLYDALTDSEYANFQCPVRTHRGISIEDGHTYWIPFYDKSARCQRGPLVNDVHNRYYWTQDDQGLRYDTLQNLEWNSFTEGYDVGVPPPTKVPAVAAPSGDDPDTDIIVTRAYVYTYETIFGEEGPPSLPTTADGADGELWVISNMLTGPNDGKRRQIGKKNIYRTVPSQTGKYSYHYVDSVSINTTQYYDRATDEEVAENRTLESLYWFPPPDDLNGLIAHPNGFFLGYSGRDVHMSEPYRPHAWNPNYTVSTLGEVVGFGVFGSSVVVCTTSFPYVLTGIHPQAMVMTQHDTAEPCLSRYGIVSMPFGVYYPGPNGLILASPQGFTNATQQLMTKEEWQNRYQVKTFDAARYQSQYVALYNTRKGIMFAPDEPMAALVDIDLAAGTYEPDQADSIFTDEYSGKTYLLSNCEMYEWNPVSGAPLEFDWTSMEFDTADPVNFGASRIIWYSNYTPPTPEQTWAWRVYNAARIAAAPLHPMNFAVINGVNVIPNLVYNLNLITDPEVNQTKVQEHLDNFEQIKQTFHWGPLVWTPVVGEPWPNTPYVIMELIANGEVIYQKLIGHDRMFRLPAGFKATRFKIRLRSNIHIQSVKVAETGKELAQF